MTGQNGERTRPGGWWLLLVPVTCCAGPLLITGLAAAGALAWGGLGLGLTAVLAGATLIIWRRRAGAARRVRRYPR
jgi:Flp pilus assembly protein TadB